MAAIFTREEVLEQVFQIDDEVEEGKEAFVEELDRQEEHLKAWINSFNGGENFDSTLFQEKAAQVLLPIFKHSFTMPDDIEMHQRSKGKCFIAI